MINKKTAKILWKTKYKIETFKSIKKNIHTNKQQTISHLGLAKLKRIFYFDLL